MGIGQLDFWCCCCFLFFDIRLGVFNQPRAFWWFLQGMSGMDFHLSLTNEANILLVEIKMHCPP